MSGCGREDRLPDGMRATCGHRIHGPTAPAFVCRDCLTADRDRLAARLEVSDDPEMSPDKIDHLEGMLESERKHSKRLAAELATARDEIARVRHANRVLDAVAFEALTWRYEVQRLMDELARVQGEVRRAWGRAAALWDGYDALKDFLDDESEDARDRSYSHLADHFQERVIEARQTLSRCPRPREDQLNFAALAQPQDGTTEGRGRMSRATRLYATHSMEELCKMLDAVPMLPHGQRRASIHLYSKKNEKLRDDIAWAISYHMADKRRPQPTTNDETRG